jgi:hypothetical protein
LGEEVIILAVGLISKDDVKNYEARSGRVEPVNEFGMEAAGPGPVKPQFLEGSLIDADDEKMGGGGLSRAKAVTPVQCIIIQVESLLEKTQGGNQEKSKNPQAQCSDQGFWEDFKNIRQV